MALRLLAWCMLLLAGFGLSAGGFQTSMQGVKQTGMAHTGTANPLDATSLYFNPGGLSFTQKNNLSLNGFIQLPKLQFKEESTNNIYEMEGGTTFPFAAYWSWNNAESKPWKVGLGVYTPFGSNVDWGNTWAGRYVLTRWQVRTIHIQPTFSYNIKDRVGIGAGFVYGRGNLALARSLPVTLPSGLDAEARMSGKAGGYGFNAGVLVRISKKLDVGVSYKSPIKYSVTNGEARFTVPEALRDSFPDTDMSTVLNTPGSLDMGITYRPEPNLAISLDVNYVGWGVYDTLAFDFAQNTAMLEDIYLPRNYKNAFTIRLGGSFDIDSTFTIRAGTFLGLNPVRDGFVSPESPDADRFGITLGATMRSSERFEIDVSVTYADGVGRLEKQADNYATLGGTYRGRAISIGVALNFNLGKKHKPIIIETPVTP